MVPISYLQSMIAQKYVCSYLNIKFKRPVYWIRINIEGKELKAVISKSVNE